MAASSDFDNAWKKTTKKVETSADPTGPREPFVSQESIPHERDTNGNGKGPKGRSKMWKIFVSIALLFLGSQVIFGVLALTLGFSSCAASCSDSPTHDSKADLAFIENARATERDLKTFDELRGCFESLHDARALNIAKNGDDGTGEETHRQLMTVDELRDAVVEGSWPGKQSGYGNASSASSPQLWVRIAELCEDRIEAETGEDWEIVDFYYPFPHSGAAPVPPKRTEGDRAVTLLTCRSGSDAGLYATVFYWRWESPARYEVRLDESRDVYAQLLETDRVLRESGSFGERRFLYDGSNVYLWELEGVEPLRDPEAFAAFVTENAALLEGGTSFNLLRSDTPLMLGWDSLSRDYPNDRPVEELSFEAGKDQLMRSRYYRNIDYAPSDLLLSGYCRSGEQCQASDLNGELSPSQERRESLSWSRPDYGCIFDTDVERVARSYLGCGDEKPLIALSKTVRRDEGNELELSTWVIVPRGVFSETPEAFCDEVNGLRDALWNELIDLPKGEQRRDLSLQVLVIDESTLAEGVDALGSPRSFPDLELSLREDMGSLDHFSYEVALEGSAKNAQWHEEWRLNRFDCEPDEVEGSIARTRAWRYGQS